MKPAPFHYFAPRTLAETIDLLEENGENARLLAGGQSLVPLMNLRVVKPDVLISLTHCPDLDYIRVDDDGVAIGAATRQIVAERSRAVRELCPLLAKALPFVGGVANRNRGTVCGSLAHADPLAELPPVAAALDARFKIASRSGERIVSAAEFFVAELTTSIEPGEMLVEVIFPRRPEPFGCAFVEVGNRNHGFAVAGVAVEIGLDRAGRCNHVRLAGMGFGPTAMRLQPAEDRLLGSELSETVLREAAEAAYEFVDPVGDFHADAAYRRHLARVLVERAVTEVSRQVSAIEQEERV